MSRINEEIERLPEKYRPLTPWTYFFLSLLYACPIVGTVFLIIHAIKNNQINRRNYARSYFCVYVIAIILIIVLIATGALSQAQ